MHMIVLGKLNFSLSVLPLGQLGSWVRSTMDLVFVLRRWKSKSQLKKCGEIVFRKMKTICGHYLLLATHLRVDLTTAKPILVKQFCWGFSIFSSTWSRARYGIGIWWKGREDNLQKYRKIDGKYHAVIFNCCCVCYNPFLHISFRTNFMVLW